MNSLLTSDVSNALLTVLSVVSLIIHAILHRRFMNAVKKPSPRKTKPTAPIQPPVDTSVVIPKPVTPALPVASPTKLFTPWTDEWWENQLPNIKGCLLRGDSPPALTISVLSRARRDLSDTIAQYFSHPDTIPMIERRDLIDQAIKALKALPASPESS